MDQLIMIVMLILITVLLIALKYVLKELKYQKQVNKNLKETYGKMFREMK